MNRQSYFSAIDLVPSLLAIAGVMAPESVVFDGEPLPDVLLGNSNASRTQRLFFRRPPDRDSFYGVTDLPDLAVRSGKWKLLCEYDGSQIELYDLTEDLAEANDLAPQFPEVAGLLARDVVAWHESLPADSGATFDIH